jgi:mono/diheme cytochrome c family protein
MPRNSVVLLSLLSLAGLVALGQSPTKQDQTTPPAQSKIPPDAVKEANPVKPTAASLATGKRMYSYDCAMCHGAKGDGKGDLAADLKSPLVDFRDPKGLQGRTDGELFYIIKNGKGEMPAEGTRAKPEQVWDMVNYVRSLSKKETAEKK